MTRKEFQIERTRIISEMLDNPDEYGIYPTTKCFEQLDALYDSLSLPPADATAEEMLARLNQSLGEPDNSIKDHSYEIRPLTVEGRREWWMYHNGVGSGEPFAQWLHEFAAQRQPQPTAEDEIPPDPTAEAGCGIYDPTGRKPTAEGAEEILPLEEQLKELAEIAHRYMYDASVSKYNYDLQISWKGVEEVIKAWNKMKGATSLHAHRTGIEWLRFRLTENKQEGGEK